MPRDGVRFMAHHLDLLERGIWLEETHDEWVAAYRLAEDPQGALVVAELRVFPRDDSDGAPGYWSNDLSQVPAGGLPARLVRRLAIQGAASSARQEFRKLRRRNEGWRAEFVHHGFLTVASEGANPTGRKGHSDLFYAEIAERYVTLWSEGSRSPAVDLHAAMAEENVHYGLATVQDFVKEARSRGLLTPAPRGRAGGELTERARQLLDDRAKDRETLRKSKTWITMIHPDLPAESKDPLGNDPATTLLAFEQVWKPKGWVMVPGSERKAPR